MWNLYSSAILLLFTTSSFGHSPELDGDSTGPNKRTKVDEPEHTTPIESIDQKKLEEKDGFNDKSHLTVQLTPTQEKVASAVVSTKIENNALKQVQDVAKDILEGKPLPETAFNLLRRNLSLIKNLSLPTAYCQLEWAKKRKRGGRMCTKIDEKMDRAVQILENASKNDELVNTVNQLVSNYAEQANTGRRQIKVQKKKTQS